MTNGFCTTILTFALRPTTLFMCQLLTLRSNRRRRWLFVQRCSVCNINYGSLILRFNHRSRVFIFVACRSPILIPIFHQRRRQPNKVRHGFGHRWKRPLRPESKTTIAWPSITFGLIAGTGCSAQAFGCLRPMPKAPAPASAQHHLRPYAKAEKSFGAKFASSQTEPSEQSKMFRAVGARSQVLSFGGSEANQTSHFVLLLLVSSTWW